MSPRNFVPRTPASRAVVLAILASGGIGFVAARLTSPATTASVTSATADPASSAKPKPLYYYDPMVPQEHYDNPDSLSSMGMKTIPKYPDASAVGANPKPGISIDPSAMQNLGIRVATATTGTLAGALDATGAIDFNQRDVAIIQSRAAGFVQRVYNRAPGDVIARGAP
ncbi:MAG: efflux RND transporter periplasmic adaptor subunit, partial [Pseudomonadota bacterium]